MRSIRLSLVVYFLVLVTVALGVIGWLSYEATRRTLRDKEATARNHLQELYENRCRELRNEYDKRILQRAETLAGLAQSQFPNLIFRELWQLGGASVAVN